MNATRRIHLVVTAVAAAAILAGPAAFAQTEEEQSSQYRRPAGSVTVQVNPSSVPETGGEVELFALVRDDRGRPLANAKVNFLTETGALGSAGRLVTTGADGGVADRLTVTAAELASLDESSFRLAAAVGGGGRDLRTANVGVGIQRAPQANFIHNAGGLLVVFKDHSRGLVTDWLWDFGDGSTSTAQSPAHTFAESGFYAVTLRSGNSVGSDEVTRLVWVAGVPDTGE